MVGPGGVQNDFPSWQPRRAGRRGTWSPCVAEGTCGLFGATRERACTLRGSGGGPWGESQEEDGAGWSCTEGPCSLPPGGLSLPGWQRGLDPRPSDRPLGRPFFRGLPGQPESREGQISQARGLNVRAISAPRLSPPPRSPALHSEGRAYTLRAAR